MHVFFMPLLIDVDVLLGLVTVLLDEELFLLFNDQVSLVVTFLVLRLVSLL